MLPLPGVGEILLIALLVGIVFFGEKVGVLGDALGRARASLRRGKSPAPPIDARDANGSDAP